MHQDTPPAKVASNELLGPASEVQPLLGRLRNAGRRGDDDANEAADEIERLQAGMLTASRQLGEWAEAMGATVDERDRLRAVLQAVVDAEAADTLGIEAALLEMVKAALKA